MTTGQPETFNQFQSRLVPKRLRANGAAYRAARGHMVYDDDEGPPEPGRLTMAVRRLRGRLHRGSNSTPEGAGGEGQPS
ncbi:MAG TPA: hypothetical protein VGS21_04050 [Acidimicrobiales bacterium]|nr:hypothetical protein [Acidimicrobiales bacterium]